MVAYVLYLLGPMAGEDVLFFYFCLFFKIYYVQMQIKSKHPIVNARDGKTGLDLINLQKSNAVQHNFLQKKLGPEQVRFGLTGSLWSRVLWHICSCCKARYHQSLLTIATEEGWKIYQLDVKPLFLNGFLEEAINV